MDAVRRNVTPSGRSPFHAGLPPGVRPSPMRAVLAALLLTAGGPLLAQAVDPAIPTTTLGAAGGTPLQQATGDAVQMVCGGFVANQDAVTADQVDLFDKCGEMVHTANRLAGNDGPVAKDLGIDADELRSALQNIAGEEIAAAGSMATEAVGSQSSNVGAHLSSILARGSGLQVSSVNRQGPFALVALDRGAAAVPSGGGASDDAIGLGRWSTFVNGAFGSGGKSATMGEDGHDTDAQGITLGTDYRVTGNTALGLALGFARNATDFRESETVAGGSLDLQSTTLSLYGLWYGARYYADGIVSVGTGAYELERRILIPSAGGLVDAGGAPNDGADRTAVAETDGMQVRASIGGGAEFTQDKLVFAPYARLSLLAVSLDGYDESGAGGLNLRVDDQEIDSLTSAVGYRIVGTFSTSFSILSPQLSFEWVHEFADDSRDIVSRYINDPRSLELVAVTDDPDRNYYTAGIGLTSVLRNRVQLYGDYKTLLDLDGVSEHVLTLGARFAL